MDPPTPLAEAPPPAYSEEQQALDRKISDALEQSLRISQPQPSSTEQDAWEEWDDAKFEAAARGRDEPISPHRSAEKDRLAREDAAQAQVAPPQGAYASSSRPSPPHVNTGNLGRRLPASPPANTSTKERPSWFAQAQLDPHAPPPPAQLHHHIPPEEPSPDEQLPAFAAVGPSLEGPPFDDVVRVQQHRTNVVAGDSPPQSPLDSVDGSNSPPSPPAWAPLRPAPRASYFPEHPPRTPPPPRVPQTQTTRTSSGAASPRPPRPPPIPFDHSMAYVKPHTLARDNVDSPTAGTVDASAFYNSAVSSLFNGPSSRPQLPKKTNALNRGPSSGSTGPNAGSYPSHTSDARTTSGSHAPIPSPNSGHESFPSQGNAYGGSYSPQPSTYPLQQSSYPPQQSSYPPQQSSYLSQQPSYPPQQPSYPPSQSPYPQQHASYPPHQQGSHPSPPQSSYAPQHQPYPPQQPQYAPQNQSYYQGYNAPVAAPGPPAQMPWTPYRDQYGSAPGHGR